MHSLEVLKSICREHGHSPRRMAGALGDLDVPLEDVDLLSRMPWAFLANRIAVERGRLDLPVAHPLLHWKLPSPPSPWLILAVIVKVFDLALSGEYAADPSTDVAELGDARELALPA